MSVREIERRETETVHADRDSAERQRQCMQTENFSLKKPDTRREDIYYILHVKRYLHMSKDIVCMSNDTFCM